MFPCTVHFPLLTAFHCLLRLAAFGAPSIVGSQGMTSTRATHLAPYVCHSGSTVLSEGKPWCSSQYAHVPSVGVLGLLQPCASDAIAVDVHSGDAVRVANTIAHVLTGGDCELAAMGASARGKAMGWGQAQASLQLFDVLKGVQP